MADPTDGMWLMSRGLMSQLTDSQLSNRATRDRSLYEQSVVRLGSYLKQRRLKRDACYGVGDSKCQRGPRNRSPTEEFAQGV